MSFYSDSGQWVAVTPDLIALDERDHLFKGVGLSVVKHNYSTFCLLLDEEDEHVLAGCFLKILGNFKTLFMDFTLEKPDSFSFSADLIHQNNFMAEDRFSVDGSQGRNGAAEHVSRINGQRFGQILNLAQRLIVEFERHFSLIFKAIRVIKIERRLLASRRDQANLFAIH